MKEIIAHNIKLIRREMKLTQIGFAEAFGILGRDGKPSEDLVGTYERAITDPPSSLIKEIVRCASIDFKKFTTARLTVADIPGDISMPKDIDDSDTNNLLDGEVEYEINKEATEVDTTKSALHKLVETNQLLAKSHYNFSESNRTLADNNKELIQLLKATGNERQQIPESFDTMMGNLLVSLSEIVSDGKKLNKHEVAALLSKAYHGDAPDTASAGTQKGSDSQNN